MIDLILTAQQEEVMFGFSRQSKKVEVREVKAVRDRRKISGERVTCSCEFSLSSSDAFSHNKIHTRGKIILNVRGCCVYPEQTLSVQNTEKAFPESRVLKVKNMVICGADGQKFNIPDLSIRRVRLVSDEHGHGIILRFIDLTEKQLDTLITISDRYSAT